ncbi:MAG: DsbA family protein [Sphingosinicella sp.]
MKRFETFALALLAALAFVPASAPGQPRAASRIDWTQQVTATPQGGFRMGNPNARVHVIEYLSLTCGHCAAFARDGLPALRSRVAAGEISLEYRNFVLNGPDMAASLLARCSGGGGYFAMVERYLGAQGEWLGRLTAASAAEQQAIARLAPNAQLQRIAQIGGLYEIAARHGVPATRGAACIGNMAEQQRLTQMRQAASARGVHGTPSFEINGALADAHDWAALAPLLQQALGRP